MRRRIRRIRARVGGRWGGSSGGLRGKEDKSIRVEKKKIKDRKVVIQGQLRRPIIKEMPVNSRQPEKIHLSVYSN